jgi:hypothetical protein
MISVFREYKHFKALSVSLVAEYPGAVIPYLPESNLPDIQLKLQHYLDDIISHPVLIYSNSVIAFLQGSIEKFKQECKQSRQEEGRRRSSSYNPGILERVENRMHSFFNGNEVEIIPSLFICFSGILVSIILISVFVKLLSTLICSKREPIAC